MQDLYSLTYQELLDLAIMMDGFVVVYRPIGGVGDAVMTLPAISALRKEWGDEMPIVVMCIDYIEAIYRHHPDVNAVIQIDPKEIESIAIERAFELMDAGCILYPLYHPCPASLYENSHSPAIKRSRQAIFAEMCDVSFNGNSYKLQPKERDVEIAAHFGLDRYVVVHLRSHDYWRDYPKILTKALLGKLVQWGKRYDIRVVSVDSTLDFQVKGVLAIHNMHLDGVIGIIDGSLLTIGPDSAMVHIGGALGGDILGIYGPTDPDVRLKYPGANSIGTYPKCKRQYCWYGPCRSKFCLKTLPPSKIFAKAKEILFERGAL